MREKEGVLDKEKKKKEFERCIINVKSDIICFYL